MQYLGRTYSLGGMIYGHCALFEGERVELLLLGSLTDSGAKSGWAPLLFNFFQRRYKMQKASLSNRSLLCYAAALPVKHVLLA